MERDGNRIYQDVIEFIRHPVETEFGPLALRVFAHQFELNQPYRKYCEVKGKTPDTVESWREIPAVPTAAFKEMTLACGPAEKTFLSSGTSRGPEKRGRHPVPRLDLYRTSILKNFSAHLLPDLAEWRKFKIFILTGSPETWPDSSLAHMMEVVRIQYGLPESAYFIHNAGLDLDGLIRSVEAASGDTHPVLLLGVTLAFLQLLEHCRRQAIPFRLPPGSRLMDTGGLKDRHIHLSKAERYERYTALFGIPSSHIVNEYGMTEMCSQFYDTVLADRINPPDRLSPIRHKGIPPWVRTMVLNPETLDPLPSGQTGILRHFDLANCGSVMALQTEDIGRAIGDGFEITGRAEGAEVRGCSLILEDLLRTS